MRHVQQATGTDCPDSRRLVAKYLLALQDPDPGRAVELVSEEAVAHGPDPSQRIGIAAFVAAHRRLHQAFGRFNLEVHDLLVDGDRAAVRLTLHGRHVGSLFGLEPTTRRLGFEQIHVYRAAGGKLVEHWMQQDDLSLLRQLGIDTFNDDNGGSGWHSHA
jgi:predicted ester cyclase